MSNTRVLGGVSVKNTGHFFNPVLWPWWKSDKACGPCRWRDRHWNTFNFPLGLKNWLIEEEEREMWTPTSGPFAPSRSPPRHQDREEGCVRVSWCLIGVGRCMEEERHGLRKNLTHVYISQQQDILIRLGGNFTTARHFNNTKKRFHNSKTF